MSYETLESLKVRADITGADDDALLERMQAAAEEIVREYCGRDPAGGEFTEYHPAGQSVIRLANFPIDEIDSVKVEINGVFETPIAATSFIVDKPNGLIRSLCGPLATAPRAGLDYWIVRSPRQVEVIYTVATGAGYTAKEAVARMVKQWYREVKTARADRDRAVVQERVGDSFVTFDRSMAAIPAEARELLRLLRNIPL